MQVLATPIVYAPVVVLARYRRLEPALRHLSCGKAKPCVDFASSDT